MISPLIAEVRIKLLSCNPPPLSFGDWADLSSAKDIEYKAGDHVVIPLGVVMQLPSGYEAHILPRSSTFKYFGLLHASSGIIDEDYCGDNDEWFFSAYATRDGSIGMGERVCQFRIFEKMPQIRYFHVEHMDKSSRGGHGSTGK